MAKIFFVLGPTCAGKTTFLEYAKSIDPETIGCVEVGKALRKKYPANYFQGQQAPEHTAEESWQIFLDQLCYNLNQNCEIILVDGQPRSLEQVAKCFNLMREFPGHRYHFLLLNADKTIRKSRILGRFTDAQKDEIDLAEARVEGDMISYYDIIVELLNQNQGIEVWNTDRPGWKEELFGRVLLHG